MRALAQAWPDAEFVQQPAQVWRYPKADYLVYPEASQHT